MWKLIVKTLFITLTSLTLNSCDVSSRLIIVNKTNKDVIVNLSSFSSGFQDSVDMTRILVPQKYPESVFYYGFGGFSEDELMLLRSSLKEVLIIEGVDTTVIRDQVVLNEMLPSKRAGIFNSVMKIKINSDTK